MNIAGDNANIGDVDAHAAGRDLYQGLNAEQLDRLFRAEREFFLTLVTSHEQQYKALMKRFDHVREDTALYRKLDTDERDKARQRLNRRLTRIELVLLVVGAVLFIVIWRLWPAITALALVGKL